jgi:hypothetical protein
LFILFIAFTIFVSSIQQGSPPYKGIKGWHRFGDGVVLLRLKLFKFKLRVDVDPLTYRQNSCRVGRTTPPFRHPSFVRRGAFVVQIYLLISSRFYLISIQRAPLLTKEGWHRFGDGVVLSMLRLFEFKLTVDVDTR